MKRIFYLILVTCLIAGCGRNKAELVDNPADYVSTLVGTLSHHGFSTGNT